MSVRIASLLSVCLLASSGIVSAQPDPAPAGDPAAPPAEGAPVEMSEDPPPSDMEGTSEDPDAPKVVGEAPIIAVPKKEARSGYPIEDALRPITLPANMSEIAIDPHLTVDPFQLTTTLRARYGITRTIQLGLNYVLASVYDDPASVTSDKKGFHPGKAVGLDVTVLLQDWVGIKVGVPIYIDPVAVSLQIGAPMKFIFDRWAIGGLDDLLNIKLSEFAPQYQNELQNAALAAATTTGTTQSRGDLRFSGYGIYNHKPNLSFSLRFSVIMDDFSSNRGNTGFGGLTTSIRAGLLHSPRHNIDLGFGLGFEDLSDKGSFGPNLFVAFRI
jgi:hypothetical protein